MILFVLTYLVVYGAMNSYMFWKVHRAFKGLGQWGYALAAFQALMEIGPAIVRWLDREWDLRLASATAPYLFSWIAITFWFCTAALAIDLWNLIAQILEHWHAGPFQKGLGMPPMPALIATVAAVLVAMALSLWEAQRIRLTYTTFQSARLPAGSKPIRVVQISDLHLGGGTGEGRLRKIISLIDEAKPDLLVSTGDMVDTSLDEIKPLADMLAKVRAPMGKIGVPGNHDYYTGIDQAAKFHEAAGFEFLKHESRQCGPMWIAGADDAAVLYLDQSKLPEESSLLPDGQGRPFTLLLKHRPEIGPTSLGRFDLQLSGHTHGGQIFPFTLIVRLMYRHSRGPYSLGEGAELYVSRGSGTWGPPMRLLSGPEVAVITIQPLSAR
ncbi:MAG: metallophosphoesterase [Phycisphaerae bacterium]